jgi:hypothetical protein
LKSPTLHADALIGLLEHCKQVAPGLSVSNGRRFADPEFTRRYAAVGLADIMAGIPVYAPEPGLHDFIVQAAGAFEETVHGILNLASLGQAVEIRVVIQRHTVPVLPDLAAFIVRNLPFIAQVALMGLEMTGLARPSSPLVWADPADYQRELGEAVDILATARIATRIYNHLLMPLTCRQGISGVASMISSGSLVAMSPNRPMTASPASLSGRSVSQRFFPRLTSSAAASAASARSARRSSTPLVTDPQPRESRGGHLYNHLRTVRPAIASSADGA